ncbi:protoporphyrinogen/coproporphyrinogen oxidase [Streptomyces sp. NPDC054796]
MTAMTADTQAGEPVAVVGAGIAGLTAAFRLRQAGCAVRVFDAAPPQRVGGRMATEERGGFGIDLGAPLLGRSYRRMLRLVLDAGLAPEILPASDLIGVAHDGTVHHSRTGTPVRLLAGELLSSLPLSDRAKLLADLRRLRPALHPTDMSAAAPHDFDTLARYALRRGLAPQTLEHFLDPLNTTLCLGEPEDTSALGAFLYLAFLLSSRGLFTSAHGSGFLPQGLARQLPVTHHAHVTSVEEHAEEVRLTWRHPGEEEHTHRARAAVLAVPPPSLPALFPQLPPAQQDFFRATRYSRLLQVTFCLGRRTREKAVLLHASRTECPHIASFLLPHNLSPARVAQGRGMITTYLRGASSARYWDLDDETIADHVLSGMAQLGVLPEAATHGVAVHVDRIDPCVVRRGAGDYRHLARAAVTHPLPGHVQLAGGDHFGHSTTIGSLVSGEESARRVLARLRPGPGSHGP